MKKITYFFIFLGGFLALVLLAGIFGLLYVAFGFDNAQYVDNTLFATLAKVDYEYFFQILLMNTVYLFLVDLIVLGVGRAWRKMRGGESAYKGQKLWVRFWQGHEKIHLTFILLTLFSTISIAAPSTLMNSFTAIVSISVLVISLTRKNQK
jgi:hypothetical protein